MSDLPLDAGVGFGSERGLPDLGSRIALVSDDRRALAVWTDTRAGTVASNKQDLAAAAVRLRGGSEAAAALAVPGAGAVLAAVVSMFIWRRKTPSPAGDTTSELTQI